jgi:hypothetical protein
VEQKTYVLADIPGFGRIFDCGECGNMHMTVGPVTITLEPQAYMQLVALVNTSAANFETWMQLRKCGCRAESPTPKLNPDWFEDRVHAEPEIRPDEA